MQSSKKKKKENKVQIIIAMCGVCIGLCEICTKTHL